MTTSYSLFQEYIPFKFVCIHSTFKFHFPLAQALKEVYFFLTFCFIISGIIGHCSIMENWKNIGENNKKLRTINPKNHMKILRTASLGSNFTDSYKKKIVPYFKK